MSTFDSPEESDYISIGECFGCNSKHVELYLSPDGLRCEECFVDNEILKESYIPSLLYTTDEIDKESRELIDNFDSFMDNLKDIELSIEFSDGSELVVDTLDTHAVFVKHGEKWKQFVKEFRRRTHEYYRNKRKPTLRRGDVRWRVDDEFEEEAELAEEILSQSLRAARVQLVLTGFSEDGDTPTVVGIGDESFSYYCESGRVTIPYNEGDFQ